MPNFNCWLYDLDFDCLYAVRDTASLWRGGKSGAIKRALAHCYQWQEKILPHLPLEQEAEGKRHLLCVNLQTEEDSQLREMARKTGDTLTGFVRRLLLYYAAEQEEYLQKNWYTRADMLGTSPDIAWDDERLQPFHSLRLEREAHRKQQHAEERAHYQKQLHALGYEAEEFEEAMEAYDEAPRAGQYPGISETSEEEAPQLAQEQLSYTRMAELAERETKQFEAMLDRVMLIIAVVLVLAVLGLALKYFGIWR